MTEFDIGMLAGWALLNIAFGVAGMRWMQRKGYPESAWVILVLSICMGFVLPLLVVNFLPSRRRPVERRPLRSFGQRPAPRLPQPNLPR